jgi:hypothetical protein
VVLPEIVYDCPRCGARHITFDVNGGTRLPDAGWKYQYEALCTCRKCKRSSIFVLLGKSIPLQQYLDHLGLMQVQGTIDEFVGVSGYVSIKDKNVMQPPADVPEEIGRIFTEGATCLAVECFNAAGTMFRLCVDLATQSIVPADTGQVPSQKVIRSLGLRMDWIFNHGLMPHSLKELSTCVKEDGNDGAHKGTLVRADADDLLDFTRELLEQLYSNPAKLERAKERRAARRSA